MKNGTAKWVSVGITAAVLIAGVGGTFAIHGRDISDLEGNGCGPARRHTTQIAVLETKLEEIKADQKAGFDTIIRLLGEKKSTQATKSGQENSLVGAEEI